VPLTFAPKVARAAEAMPEGAAFSFDILTGWIRARAAAAFVSPERPEAFSGDLD